MAEGLCCNYKWEHMHKHEWTRSSVKTRGIRRALAECHPDTVAAGSNPSIAFFGGKYGILTGARTRWRIQLNCAAAWRAGLGDTWGWGAQVSGCCSAVIVWRRRGDIAASACLRLSPARPTGSLPRAQPSLRSCVLTYIPSYTCALLWTHALKY